MPRCRNCKTKFTPKTFLQKFCFEKDCITAMLVYNREQRAKKGKGIPKESEKRKKENRAYTTLREVYLQGKICPITGRKATEIHHKKGRIGKLLCDIKNWLPVSRAGHIWIENNPKEAKEKGYSLDRL